MTLEDPVEYPVSMMRQTSVNEVPKMNFASGIRSILRQDPARGGGLFSFAPRLLMRLADVPATEGLNIVSAVAGLHPDLALDFALAHPAEVNARLDPNSRALFVPELASQSAELDAIEKLDAFAVAHPEDATPRSLTTARGAIRLARRLREQRLPEIARWLAAHPN